MNYKYLFVLISLSIGISLLSAFALLGVMLVIPDEFGLLFGLLFAALILFLFVGYVIPRMFKKTIDSYWKEHEKIEKTQE